jgi:hypothetical protein
MLSAVNTTTTLQKEKLKMSVTVTISFNSGVMFLKIGMYGNAM